MILTGSKIKEEIKAGNISIKPFCLDQVNPNSYNYRLGITIKVFNSFDGKKAIFKKIKIPKEGYVLEPRKMYLANTKEVIGSSRYAMSLIGRSSMGRYGLFLQVSANLGHTTSKHKWTLEIVATQKIRLYPEMIIGQVSFWKNFGAVKKYKAVTYIDDAHATGILGKHGRGIEDYFDVEGETDIIMGTFTKCFGGVGGFVVSSKDIIDYLKIRADSFIFTAPIAPPVVYGLIKAIELVEKETWRREKLLENAKYLKEKLSELGIDFRNSQTQIIPVMIGDEKKAMKASEILLKNGIFVPAARWPAVPLNQARLRVTVTSEHTKEQVDLLVENIKKVKKEVGF